MRAPIGEDQRTRVFGCVADSSGGIRAKDVTEPICDLYLAIRAKQAPVLLRFAV